MRREEVRVPAVECLDGLARITSKELAPIHFVKNGTLQNACFTRPRVVADLGKSALTRIARLTNSPAKGLKRMVTQVQWPCSRSMSHTIERGDPLYATHQIHDNWVAYPRIWSRRSLFSGKAQTYGNRSDVFDSLKVVARHTKIRHQNPSLGMICPGEPHQRSPNAPKI